MTVSKYINILVVDDILVVDILVVDEILSADVKGDFVT